MSGRSSSRCGIRPARSAIAPSRPCTTATLTRLCLSTVRARITRAAYVAADITDSESFGALQSWYQELQKNVPNCIIVLAGNKVDLERERTVARESAAEFARDHEVRARMCV